MSTVPNEDDVNSTFSDDEGSFNFNLSKLQMLVSEHLRKPCTLVYDVNVPGEDGVSSVVRVACPDFPVDKLKSEVATLQHIAAVTSVPVPKVLAWTSDPSNPSGAEYMIVEKIPGVPASEVWKTLQMNAKETFVRDIARFLLALFGLRFSQAGSLYPAAGFEVQVGPLVSTPFYHATDGEVRFADAGPLDLSQFRGPFSSASEYLASAPKAELYTIKHRRSHVLQEFDGDEARLELGERVLDKVVRLTAIYPGDIPLGTSPISNDGSPSFSLKLDDFRLGNIMVDERSGKVLGLIDFEATTTAPLWICAALPHWLEEIEDNDAAVNAVRSHLTKTFNDTLEQEGAPGKEWRDACDKGRWFRAFSSILEYQVQVWANEDMEKWVDERLAFAVEYPGVGLRDKTLDEEIEARYGSISAAPAT